MGPPAPLSEAPDPAFPILARCARRLGVRAWVVGGYVRDRLLQRPNPDLDVVVEGPGGQGLGMAECFAEATGSRRPVLFERFGTAQVTWEERLVEFASARAESYAPDSRKPEVRAASLEEDLERRDFTVNTLVMDLEGGLHDFLGVGLKDLEARVLRTPRDPRQTFSDDPLRMLRAVRFAAQLGFEPAPDVLPAMRELAGRARPPVLSVERAQDELRKMLLSERPARALELLDAGGLLAVLLPEVAACKGVEQGGYHTHDVFGHTVLTVAHTRADLRLRLAALFHDVGKPVTASPEGTFYEHDRVGAELAQAALARLRFPNALAEQVARLVRLHLRPVFYQPDEWTDSAVRRLAREAGPLLWPLLELGRADIAASAYPHPEKLDDLERRLREVLAERPSRMSLPVSGKDIMEARKLAPGPEVGRLKERLQELVLEGRLEPEREAILEYLRRHPEV